MKKLVLLSLSPFYLLVSQANTYAYPQVEMEACINNAITTVAQKGISATYKKVRQYCDCSLKKILDEGKDINASVSYCNKKHIYQ